MVRRGLRQVQQNVNKKLRSESRKELKQISSVPEDFAFWAVQKQEMLKAIGTLPEELLLEGAVQAERLGLAVDFTLVNQEVLQLAGVYRNEWWNNIQRSTQNSLRTAIQTHIESGEPLSVLEKRIEPLFGAKRAQVIASTEVTRLYADGNATAYRDAGIGEVEFQTVRDARVDPDCDDLQGARFPVGQVDTRPPVHSRCRCWIAPVSEGVALNRTVEPPTQAIDTPPLPEVPPWRGKITGATKKQEEIIRRAMGRIPKKVALENKLGTRFVDIEVSGKLPGDLFGRYIGRIQLNKRYLRPTARVSVEQIEFDIIHEAGHGVMSAASKNPRFTGGVTTQELRGAASEFQFVSDYARKNVDEAWAEGFAARITRGAKLGPKSEKIFTRLGI